MSSSGFFDAVSTILAGVAQRHGLDQKLLEFRLRRQWPEIVGPQIAAHTQPDQIRFKKLYLLVKNSVWLYQLTFLKPDLLEKVNAAAGAPVVTDVVLRLGEIPSAARALSDAIDSEGLSLPPTQQSIDEAAAHAGAVQDADLRAHLTAIMAQALAQRETRSRPSRSSTP
ncbi:MAG: DUF721 domain-containing protein [Nitrospiraceae bacterium]